MCELMPKQEGKNGLNEEEIALRRDEAIHRALNTPPKPHKESVRKGEPAKAQRKSPAKRYGRSSKETI
jgi:hypothetical protein